MLSSALSRATYHDTGDAMDASAMLTAAMRIAVRF
jgi:hypothetical protein